MHFIKHTHAYLSMYHSISLSLSLSLYIYIYIYRRVCMCVCVCIYVLLNEYLGNVINKLIYG